MAFIWKCGTEWICCFCLLNREAGCYPLRSERDSRENLPLS
ncbi:hypothetical protein FORC44_p192 (plasmid) [Escherichia coli]|uniref:Uncharacterized protein n=1 Tax=Escherichia coli TaxID=562 RepID=A0A890DL18_ECOLX|nr:hypothetical protein ECH74115_B0039 [Escherichia coli O157:H7 str. EC4115]ASL56652.1 hypothetical protein FORC44_p192 [Escherichia coli]EDZ84592.1 hypothetical protein ECH74042_B0038 [Escherichia coli O157:H7 str. EC4042]EEC25530.1 hypothetical protein ESCCO14588_A0018 [Escherichia coli O157:H7 str. TW14588]ESE09828.1 hypothetical protein HMPREF1616_00911 [Escherichia coli 908658]